MTEPIRVKCEVKKVFDEDEIISVACKVQKFDIDHLFEGTISKFTPTHEFSLKIARSLYGRHALSWPKDPLNEVVYYEYKNRQYMVLFSESKALAIYYYRKKDCVVEPILEWPKQLRVAVALEQIERGGNAILI